MVILNQTRINGCQLVRQSGRVSVRQSVRRLGYVLVYVILTKVKTMTFVLFIHIHTCIHQSGIAYVKIKCFNLIDQTISKVVYFLVTGS